MTSFAANLTQVFEAKRQTPDNAHRNVPMSEEVGVGNASLDAVSVTGGGKELSLVW